MAEEIKHVSERRVSEQRMELRLLHIRTNTIGNAWGELVGLREPSLPPKPEPRAAARDNGHVCLDAMLSSNGGGANDLLHQLDGPVRCARRRAARRLRRRAPS